MAGFGSVPTVGGGGKGSVRADEIDYFIRGHEMQFVEIELDPGESAIAEAGVMMFMAPSIEMETVFGDGSKPQTGFFGKLARRRQAPAHRREPVHDGVHAQRPRQGASRIRGALSRQDHGHATSTELGGKLICQKDSFLCAAQGRVDRHRLPEARSGAACSAAKASSCRSSRATASSSSTPAAR